MRGGGFRALGGDDVAGFGEEPEAFGIVTERGLRHDLPGEVETRLLRSEGRHQEAIDLLTASEPAARRVFTGGHAPRLAHILAILARAQVGLGYQAERFKAAEANLVEAYSIVPPTKSTALACEQGLCDLYTAWHAAEPGKGYDTKAAEWKAKLESPSTPSEDKKP